MNHKQPEFDENVIDLSENIIKTDDFLDSRNINTLNSLAIIDDSAQMRSALESWMNAFFPEVQITVFSNAEAFFSHASEKPFDVVLMDVQLPGMDGFSAARQLKQTSPPTKVILISVLDEDLYRDQVNEIGAEAFVPKQQLYDKLLIVLRRYFVSQFN